MFLFLLDLFWSAVYMLLEELRPRDIVNRWSIFFDGKKEVEDVKEFPNVARQ